MQMKWMPLFAVWFFAVQAVCADISTISSATTLEYHGLCIQVGANRETTRRIKESGGALLHLLEPSADKVVAVQREMRSADSACSVIVEHWNKPTLPHADNLANFIVVELANQITSDEIDRVLRPGGMALVRRNRGDYEVVSKKRLDGTDEWTHQWHDVDGGLTTNDRVGVPQGLQWVAGPLFAMAGRKSSTQTLVTSGGLNFYVTQNALDNVGLPAEEMKQYLVARDSFNGLVRWQRPWTGPFVTGNGETNPRMVASNGRLYASMGGGLVRIDPKTGATVASVQLPVPPEKIVVFGARVLVQWGDEIRAFDDQLKQQAWSFTGKQLSGLALNEGHCFLVSSGRSEDGKFQHTLISLSLETGATEWKQNTQPHVEAARVRINFAQDDFVALQAHGSLHMFSAHDGRHLWTRKTEARPGKTYVDERYVGHFYRRGLVWMLKENSPRESDGQNVWLGLNPQTGEVDRTLETKGSWPRTDTPAKMGCQVLIASERFIMIPRQATFVDFDSGEKLSFKFTRGGCGLGFVPANGLVYSHPHACGCYSDAIRGFMGMHSIEGINQTIKQESPPVSARLVSYSPSVASRKATVTNESTVTGDWPIYRGNGQRSGSANWKIGHAIGDHLWTAEIAGNQDVSPSQQAWELRTGNRITAATAADGRAFVADVDAGILYALESSTGKRQWSFQASGRIDSPPTLHQGMCLFGSHDGYVYCLNSKNGELLWKFRAAPLERRIVAFGNLESTWPVAGTVLVQDDVAFVAAGRAPDADGGIEVHALQPATGEALWSTRIEGGAFRGLSDYLIGGEGAIYLGNQKLDPKTGKFETVEADSRHLQGGKVGLLEASWTKHDLALRKEIQTWKAAGTSGQLLAFAPHVNAAYNFEANQVLIHGDEHEHLPVVTPRQVTGMALAEDVLVLAGGLNRKENAAGGFVQVVDLETGEVTSEVELHSEVVFDGVALTGNQILVSMQDGRLQCFPINAAAE